MNGALVVLAIAVAALWSPRAKAHGMTSAYVEITELEGGRASIRLSATQPITGLSVPAPSGCRDDDESDANTAQRVVNCDGQLEGRVIEVAGIGPFVSEVVLQVNFRDGNTTTRILTTDEPAFHVPRASRKAALLVDYVRLGVKHILLGADHLLFLAALAISVRKFRAILLAETAFTASHSLSFTASALGWVHVSSIGAEVCIALSLIFVAIDAARAAADDVLIAPRRAAGLAFAFGLVHGLGFAGGLTEIGLPDRAVGFALLGFAGGVEIGQVIFLALFAGLLALLARRRFLSRAPLVIAYAVGAAGAFLFLERTLALFARP